jgi:hypothetical protein
VEPIGTYLRARRALAAEGPDAFLEVLNNAAQTIPITSYMGLLGSSGVSLTDKRQAAVDGLRDYAVRCSTAVESLLRLAEWGEWMTKTHAAALSEKVRTGIIEAGVEIPFFKVTKAFLAAPDRVRRMVLEPLYLPLLRHFGQQTAALLPPPGPLTFVQPANYLHIMSFLLYATLASATPTRLLLLDKKGVEEVDPLPLDAVGKHLADSPHELERWLLSEFGGLATQYDYTYKWDAIGETLRSLDPQAPLLLDLPFGDNLDILEALLPFERVFNLSGAYGAPGEVCLSYQYYAKLFIGTERWSYSVWTRYSDSAAQSFAEFMDRLAAFRTLAAEADALSAKVRRARRSSSRLSETALLPAAGTARRTPAHARSPGSGDSGEPTEPGGGRGRDSLRLAELRCPGGPHCRLSERAAGGIAARRAVRLVVGGDEETPPQADQRDSAGPVAARDLR